MLDVIGDHIGPTLMLSGISLFFSYLLSIPLGLYCSRREGKPDERTLSVSLYMLYSLPAFVAALMLQIFFSVKLQGTWFELDPFGMKSPGNVYDAMSTWEQVVDRMKHLIMPVFCYTYATLAYETRFIRANMAEVVRQDFIRTARAKGVSERMVYFKHAFRNTLIPLVTMLGLALPTLLSGSVILESIFNWPGIGGLLFQSIGSRDYPLIMGLVLIFAVLTLFGQLLADILYAVVDPRIVNR
ncbi:MAG: ABC transporter permease [Pirellulales bacterium]